MPRLLALDLSTHTGYAIFERYKTPFFGSWYAPPEIVGKYTRRFAALWKWLDEMRQVHGYDSLAFEEPLVGVKTDTAHMARLLIGFANIVETYAGVHDLPVLQVPVPTVKRALTGDSYADKKAMVRAAMKNGWSIGGNDDRADAGGVGLVAYSKLWPKTEARP